MRPDQSLSIVLAAYNEEKAIQTCTERVQAFLNQNIEDGEIILVNDGSDDGTGRIIDRLSKNDSRIISLHLEKNSGMGAALLRGYGKASKEWVTMLPADGQIDPFELQKLFELADQADIVTSLYKNRTHGLIRLVISQTLRILTAAIVGTRARTEGTYLIRNQVLKKLNPRSHSFLLNLEIPIRAKKSGYRLKTAWINVSPRIAGQSKAVTIRRVFQTLIELFLFRCSIERERWRKK